MNTFEFERSLKKIKKADILSMMVEAAQYAESQILEDSKQANARGLTFSGGAIEGVGRFTDWIDSGEFHKNLKFLESENIEFFSSGDGFEAIKEAFNEFEWIAPHANTLSDATKSKLITYFIDFFKQQIQINNK
jgi:hypothetical protein